MILHWLAGYSLARLMIIVGGIVICIGNGVNLLSWLEDKNRVPVPISLIGILLGACLAISALLRGKPPWDGLGDALSVISGLSSIIYVVLLNRYSRRKRVVRPPQPPSTAPSNQIWPPPPTSPGGGQP